VTLFKNIRLGGNRRLQLRWEIYNVFSQWKKRLRPHLAEDMGILGEVSPSVRAGGGAPAPVEKKMTASRRSFLFSVGASALTGSAGIRAAAGLFPPRLYPPTDLSYFDTPISAAPPDIRIGYAAITWGGKDHEAIADIAEAGYRGIQLRSNIVPDYESRPRALADELAQRRLTFVALSSGDVVIDPEVEAKQIATHVAHAKFVRECGGLYLQCIDARPKRPLTKADYQRLGRLLTEIGKRSADLGIPLGYHNHMNSIGERPEEIDRILEAADPRYVKLELDVTHYQQGGGDPIQAIRKYADRLLFLHIKDVESPVGSGGSGRPGEPGRSGGSGGSEEARPSRDYRFVELGRGQVDVKGVFAAMHEVKFRGWAVVELDAVPDKARTPKESALINRKYLESIGVPVVEAQTSVR
jgi:inosose dehydratase